MIGRTWARATAMLLTVATLAGCSRAVRTSTTTPPPATAESLQFGGFAHEAIGGAGLAREGSRLRVANIGGSGTDGVRIRLPAGVTALRVNARTADEAQLAPGAWLQVSSCGSGGVSDSIGYLRITRLAAGGYEVSGGLNGGVSQELHVYRGGRLVHREPAPTGAALVARVPGCLACGSNLNDAVTSVAGRASSLVLRWQWARALPVVLVHPAGADTVVAADELRLVATPHGTPPVALSEFDIRGKDLGDLWIHRETATRAAQRR